MSTQHEEAARQVLVIEDDALQGEAIRTYLEGYGLDVTCTRSADEARALLERLFFDVVVMDRMLARRDALPFLRELRERFDIPVIVTSALGGEVDRIAGLDWGADDYLAKPVSLPELLARIRAVHRRHRSARPSLPRGRIARFGNWTLDVAGYRLTHARGATTDLSAGELEVLLALLEHPRRVLARRDLLTLTRRDGTDVFERAIDVLISRLRRKLEEPDAPSVIRTVRGGGYQVAVDVDWAAGQAAAGTG